MDGFLRKPISGAALAAALAKVLTDAPRRTADADRNSFAEAGGDT